MNLQPRLRIIAGPNGSGKSSLLEGLAEKNVPLGLVLNADVLEAQMRAEASLQPDILEKLIKLYPDMAQAWAAYWEGSTYAQKLNAFLADKLFSEGKLQSGFLSYLSAAIIECFRELLLEKRQDITFETVFSHPSKLDFMRVAKENGYKVYLYYVCLDDPDMNIARVQTRVKMGGHAVAASVIRERYFRSLENLIPAFELADSAYLINNFHLFLKKKGGETSLVPGETVPSWAHKLLDQIAFDHTA